MSDGSGIAAADPQVLTEIIRTQTEIVKLGLDLGGVVGFVAERVQRLTHAGGAVVELVEGEDMVYRAAAGMVRGQLGLRLKRAGSLSGLCVAQRRTLRCDDSETDARVDREACRRVGLRSMVVAPLDHNGTMVGVLKIAAAEPGAFSGEHVHILELMSELIAASMFHAAKYATNELYHLATHDALTGLANRALFYDRLRQSLALARRQFSQISILNLDMDGLKPINDQHGHRAGDAAIRETASRIRRMSRQHDTVARLGGDEFGVILTEVPSRDGLTTLAERIAEEIRQPFQFESHPRAAGRQHRRGRLPRRRRRDRDPDRSGRPVDVPGQAQAQGTAGGVRTPQPGPPTPGRTG
jgi:diguanylate cyclase (GGDEF)-like protein